VWHVSATGSARCYLQPQRRQALLYYIGVLDVSSFTLQF
jgi:hypothetical protein